MLYLKYAPLLKGVCARYVKDRDDANDVLQDAFVDIFRQFPGIGVQQAVDLVMVDGVYPLLLLLRLRFSLQQH